MYFTNRENSLNFGSFIAITDFEVLSHYKFNFWFYDLIIYKCNNNTMSVGSQLYLKKKIFKIIDNSFIYNYFKFSYEEYYYDELW